MFADVIVDITNFEVDKIFEYCFRDDNVKLGSRVRVPFGNKIIDGIVIAVKEKNVYSIDKIKSIINVIDDTPVLSAEMIELMDYMKSSYYVTRASALRLFLPSEMRTGRVKERFVKYLTVNDDVNYDEVILSLRKSAIKQKDFLNFLLENRKIKQSDANELFGFSAVKTMTEKGYALVMEEKDLRLPYKTLDIDNKSVILTENQLKAVESVKKTEKSVTLLYGVTGSGKTEVYLSLIDDAIKKGKSAIMLVPEIALTPQMLKQLRARFGDNAAILHSGLSAGERFDEWWRLRNGEVKIAIGARSAIFAPVENLGLVVIDEEHDGSYSSESSPRYNTIDVAKFRCDFNGAKLILGSATPSVESYMCAKNGIYNLVTLPNRINKKPLPEIIIADMRQEVRRGNNSPFSSVFKTELEACLDNGNQTIVFLNQRGYSKTVICTECGHVQKCESCDVSLTYHKEDESLLCHYCGAKYKMITACTECGSKYIRYGGTGTERVVIELKKLFPKARILRMDRDTAQTKEGHFNILTKFANKEADILVGTQMIAKGHDFPSVTLVGILDADMSLHFSDYRSGERTFQLLTQVAGRSGRANDTGKVVLQTYAPENLVLRQAINYDYEGLYEHEISLRKATAFPPFTDIIRILISGENQEETLRVTKAIYEELNVIYAEEKGKFRFFGCMKAPIKRLQNKFRYQVLMRIESNNKELSDKIYYSAIKYKSRAISVLMEVNPNNLT